MTKLLLRIFIHADPSVAPGDYHAEVGKLAGFTGILCNCLLFLSKVITGILVGSVAIIADAVNNLSDAAASLVALLGFRLAQRPADRDHPFGHARYEYLSGLAVAVMILLAGLELSKTSIHKILHPEPIIFSLTTILILLSSILVKFWMSGFFRKLGALIHSRTLNATAVDSRNDVIATSAVLISFLINHYFRIPLDGVTGLAVAVFILYSGILIGRDTITPLLGTQADKGLSNALTDLVQSHDKILGTHDLLIHDYGPGQCFASIHAEMDAAEDPLNCHDILEEIECAALNDLNVHLVIHYDPVVTDDPQWKSLQEQVEIIAKGIDPGISIHDFRIIRNGQQQKLVFDMAVPYGKVYGIDNLKKSMDDGLHASGADYETFIHFDRKQI